MAKQTGFLTILPGIMGFIFLSPFILCIEKSASALPWRFIFLIAYAVEEQLAMENVHS